MASNVFSINPYKINQRTPTPLLSIQTIALPTTGVSVEDVTSSPTRSLSTGVNVYSKVTDLASGTQYYCRETFSQMVTLINA